MCERRCRYQSASPAPSHSGSTPPSRSRDVAVDNTNPSQAEWTPLIEVARRYDARVTGYWFPPDLRGSLERNAVRMGRARVPDVGLYSTLRRLRRPRLADGFD